MQSPLKLARVFLPTSAAFGSGPRVQGDSYLLRPEREAPQLLTNYRHANLLKIISNKDVFNLLVNLPQRTDKHKPRRERKKRQLCHPRDPTHTVLFQKAHTPNHLEQQQQYSKENSIISGSKSHVCQREGEVYLRYSFAFLSLINIKR